MGMALELSDLTPNQYVLFKKHIYNGVGSDEYWLNPRDFIFGPAAEIHDLKYFVGGTEEDRLLVDEQFLANSLVLVNKQSKWKQPFYRAIAHIYYFFLTKFSKKAWEYYDKPAETWIEMIQHVKTYYIRENKPILDWLVNAETII